MAYALVVAGWSEADERSDPGTKPESTWLNGGIGQTMNGGYGQNVTLGQFFGEVQRLVPPTKPIVDQTGPDRDVQPIKLAFTREGEDSRWA